MNWQGKNLHLGCGSHRLGGDWVNVDGQRVPGVDVVLDIHKDLGSIPNDALGWIYTSHVIEHCFPDKLPEVFGHFYRMLRRGGKLLVATVDFEKVYLNRFKEPRNGPHWEVAIHGHTNSTAHPMEAHRVTFSFRSLSALFTGAGFQAVKPWRTEDYSGIHALNDFARSCALVTCFCEGVKP